MKNLRIMIATVILGAGLGACQSLPFLGAGLTGEATRALEARLKETVEVRAQERAVRRATIQEMTAALNEQARAAAADGDLDRALDMWRRSLEVQDRNSTEFLIERWLAQRRDRGEPAARE